METVTGRLVKIISETSGVKQSDGTPWKKKDILIDLGGNNSKKLVLPLFNTNCNITMKEGDTITANISLSSREYNGKWYYDVFASNISVVSNKTYHQNEDSSAPITGKPKYNNAKEVRDVAVNNSLEPQEDDLPF